MPHSKAIDETLTSAAIFKLLEIAPTKDFTIVRKAYLSCALKYHPDKAKPGEREQAEAHFKRIGQAYEKVDSPEKLNAFLTNGPSRQKQKPHRPLSLVSLEYVMRALLGALCVDFNENTQEKPPFYFKKVNGDCFDIHMDSAFTFAFFMEFIKKTPLSCYFHNPMTPQDHVSENYHVASVTNFVDKDLLLKSLPVELFNTMKAQLPHHYREAYQARVQQAFVQYNKEMFSKFTAHHSGWAQPTLELSISNAKSAADYMAIKKTLNDLEIDVKSPAAQATKTLKMSIIRLTAKNGRANPSRQYAFVTPQVT